MPTHPQIHSNKTHPSEMFLFRRDCFVWRKWLTWGSARKNLDFILPNPIFVSFFSSCPAQNPKGYIILFLSLSFLLLCSDLLEMKSHFLRFPRGLCWRPIGSLIVIVSLVLSFSLLGCLPVNLYLLIWADTISFENGFTNSLKTHWPLL